MTEVQEFQRAHASGPGTLTIRGGHAIVRIEASAECEYAEVRVTQEGGEAGGLKGIRVTAQGSDLSVVLPDTSGGGSVQVNHFGSSVVQIGNVTGGMIVQSGRGVHISNGGGGQVWVNGQLVSGPGSGVQMPGPITITARVPACSSLDLAVAAGEITAEGRYKLVRHDTSAADLDVEYAERVQASASSGSVYVREVVFADVTASSGSVRIGSARRVNVTTSSGSIRVRAVSEHATVRASSGSVEVHVVADAEVNARTSSGSLEVTAAPGARPRVRHSTSSGRVRVPHTG